MTSPVPQRRGGLRRQTPNPWPPTRPSWHERHDRLPPWTGWIDGCLAKQTIRQRDRRAKPDGFRRRTQTPGAWGAHIPVDGRPHLIAEGAEYRACQCNAACVRQRSAGCGDTRAVTDFAARQEPPAARKLPVHARLDASCIGSVRPPASGWWTPGQMQLDPSLDTLLQGPDCTLEEHAEWRACPRPQQLLPHPGARRPPKRP